MIIVLLLGLPRGLLLLLLVIICWLIGILCIAVILWVVATSLAVVEALVKLLSLLFGHIRWERVSWVERWSRSLVTITRGRERGSRRRECGSWRSERGSWRREASSLWLKCWSSYAWGTRSCCRSEGLWVKAFDFAWVKRETRLLWNYLLDVCVLSVGNLTRTSSLVNSSNTNRSCRHWLLFLFGCWPWFLIKSRINL